MNCTAPLLIQGGELAHAATLCTKLATNQKEDSWIAARSFVWLEPV